MSLFLNGLPTAVRVGGKSYAIESNFRLWMQFEMLLFRGELLQSVTLFSTLETLFLDEMPPIGRELFDALLWFYRGGKEIRQEEREGGMTQPVYSYEQDDGYIYAAFLEQYNIDLTATEYLHWWKFRALFDSLHKDTKMVEIMGYRGMQITNDMTQSQKDLYNKMKRFYALSLPKEEQEYQDAVIRALQNGGDLTGLV